MRRRLTVAMLLLVAATLVVTGIGSFYFVRRAAVTTAQTELAGQGRAIERTAAESGAKLASRAGRELEVIRATGDFSAVRVLRLQPDGSLVGNLPPGLEPQDLHIRALQAGEQVVGHVSGLEVFTAVPIPGTTATGAQPILVITRRVHNPADGLVYFGVIGAVALVLAGLVALALARRFTRPLVAAVDTTGRIARGDLDARVTPHAGDDDEFTRLATSINTMASALARARDQERQFLLSVSHELRTPLTSIRGYAEAITDGAADDPVAAAAVIETEAGRLERLVRDLLDLARLDADRFTLSLAPVDCDRVARAVAGGFRPGAGRLEIDLVVVPAEPSPLWVQADADRLAQIVANLVENASTFATGQVVVGTTLAAGRPVLWVADDGPGIPASDLSRVFERHYTSDRADGRHTGSGLGLAIVAELAAAMGASVRAESPVVDGHGTRMVVLFPAQPPDGAERQPPNGRERASAGI